MPQNPSAIAAKFRTIDVHDDTVESVQFVPATSKRTSAKVLVNLNRHWNGRRRTIEFSGCANFQFVVDADVLQNNAPNNTSGVSSETDPASIRQLFKRHKPAWDVTYQRSIDPLPAKLESAGTLVLFHVQLFGGRLDVVARGYRLRHLTTRSSGPVGGVAAPSSQ